jgi:hypothetical protein
MRLEFVRPPLYPKQKAAVYDAHRYSVIEASTKSGKTAGCLAWLIEQGFNGRDGQNFWWVAPVTGQADIAFRRALRAIPRDLYIAGATYKTISLVNGATIWFKSADKPDSLYGDDVHAAVIDEASRMKEDSFHAVRSTLTHTNGPLRIIGNVKGRRNWFYAMARRAQEGDPRMGYHRIVAGDAVHAGVLKSEEIEDAKRMLPENVFRELYLAEASDDEGNPFGHSNIKACIAPLSKRPPFLWGWDLARAVDWTVGIALDEKGCVCAVERFNQVPWEVTIDRIVRATNRKPALVDSSGLGDPILDRLQRAMYSKFEGYQFTGPSKQKLMEGLALAIQTKQVTYPAGPIVLELSEFQYEYRRNFVAYSAPQGFHDDCVCALALAVSHYTNKRRNLDYASLKWVK